MPGAQGVPMMAESEHWHISLRLRAGRVLRHGMDPAAFLRYLAKLGRIEAIVTLSDTLPAFEQFDAETCYLGFEIALQQPHGRQGRHRGRVRVRAGRMPAAHRAAAQPAWQTTCRSSTSNLANHPLLGRHAGPLRHADRSRTGSRPEDTTRAGARQAYRHFAGGAGRRGPRAGGSRAGQAEAGARSARPGEAVGARGCRQAGPAHRPGGRAHHRRGPAPTCWRGAAPRNIELQESNATLAGLVQEVRDSALQLRMVKIGGTFSRFQRVVHDVSRELGKDIGLVVSGEDTELDKTVVELIGDPLTHLVRNAVDHGIESSDEARRDGQAGARHRVAQRLSTTPAASSSRSATTAAACRASASWPRRSSAAWSSRAGC